MITNFEPGQSQRLLGKTFTYAGIEAAYDNKEVHQKFTVDTGASSSTVYTLTKLNKDGRPSVREPAILKSLFSDTYIAPSLHQEPAAGKEITLAKGEQKTDEGLTLKLVRYGMAGGEPQRMRAFALIEAQLEGKTEEIKPELTFVNGHFEPVPVNAFEDYQIILAALNTGEEKVKLEIQNRKKPAAARLDVEITDKPFINLVWLGAVMITAGTLWAAWRRYFLNAAQDAARTVKTPPIYELTGGNMQ